MSNDYCSSCGKPLGSTLNKCHECGGKTYRAGEQYNTGASWKVELGLMDKLRNIIGEDND